jgi:16S rRNA (guanine527-N7)-methyltransferase
MTELAAPARRRLGDVLARSAALGWLGPAPVDAQIDHALAMAGAVAELSTSDDAAIVDLGSGGGVPGLVIALALAPRATTLLEGSARRAAFLRSAAAELAGPAVIGVAEGRAEELARQADLEGRYSVCTARSFGRPAVTAECAARLLAVGGVLIVSEPPDSDVPEIPGNAAKDPSASATTAISRWDASGMATLGFGEVRTSREHGAHIAMARKTDITDSRYPRRVGIPDKRPLW